MRGFAAAALAVLVLGAAANAGMISTTLGDMDGLGFAVPMTPGSTYPVFPFDNRTASDPTFTDFGRIGETDANFTFSYSPFSGTVDSALLTFGLAGLEDAHNDSGQPDWNDRLFLDSVEIPGAFDSDYTGIHTYGIVTLAIPSSLYYLLPDGTAAFFFDAWPSGTVPGIRAGDQVSFDYVTLSIGFTPIQAVSEPQAIVLLAMGVSTALALGRLRLW